MSSPHKQSKNRKGNHARSQRRNRNNGNNSKPTKTIRTYQTIKSKPKRLITPIQQKTLTPEQNIGSYLEALTKDAQIYQNYKHREEIAPRNLLTQIQRHTQRLTEKLNDQSLNKNQLNDFEKNFDNIKYVLKTMGYEKELKSYEKQMKKQGLQKDPITNHFRSYSY